MEQSKGRTPECKALWPCPLDWLFPVKCRRGINMCISTSVPTEKTSTRCAGHGVIDARTLVPVRNAFRAANQKQAPRTRAPGTFSSDTAGWYAKTKTKTNAAVFSSKEEISRQCEEDVWIASRLHQSGRERLGNATRCRSRQALTTSQLG